MKLIFFIFCSFLFFRQSYSQQTGIYVGTTQVNLDYSRDNINSRYKLDSLNPNIALLHFVKIGNTWKSFYEIDSLIINYYNLINFGIYYRGRKISTNSAILDTSMNTIPWFEFPYRFKNPKIPRIGSKSLEFAGELGYKYFQPLLFSNSLHCKKISNILYKKPTRHDKIQVQEFLISEAKVLSLGDLKDKKNIVDRVTKVLTINDTCKIVVANINLNIYCYIKKIPFDSTGTEDNPIAFSEESQALAYRNKTSDCYFLIKNHSTQYIGHSMKLLDYADFDNDGHDEIIFRQDLGDNYAGYVMISDKLTKVFKSGWSFH